MLDAIDVPRLGAGLSHIRSVRVLADKAYSGRANREFPGRHRIKATIPVLADQASSRRNRGRAGGCPPAFDPVTYRDRNTVERGINLSTFTEIPRLSRFSSRNFQGRVHVMPEWERTAAGGSMVLTSNRGPVDWYPLFPNPVVAESLLDRLVNTSH